MKAVFCTQYGPPEVLQFREIEKPVPGSRDVLIKVRAATVTMGDCEMRNLTLPLWTRIPVRILMGYRKPKNLIPGMEFSGVVESVGKDVKSFKPGDALPKELELAKALGVSRNVLREALSRLRMLGMIETRKKRGMILSRPDILGTFEKVLDPLIIDKDTLQDIFELRLVLEMGLADLLFIRKTDKDVDELKLLLKEKLKMDAIPLGLRMKLPFTENFMK